MDIYLYDEKTKEYLVTETAEADPEETKIKGEFVPLIPANATTIQPLKQKEGEAVVFNNGEWNYIKDYRGQEQINLKNNEISFIVELGEIKEGYELYSKYILSDIYKQKCEQEKRKQKALLCLTGADVERAIYKAKGLDFDDVLKIIENIPSIDSKALKIEFKANNFYRGNPYIDSVGAILGFTTEQLDMFFETNDYKVLTEEYRKEI